MEVLSYAPDTSTSEPGTAENKADPKPNPNPNMDSISADSATSSSAIKRKRPAGWGAATPTTSTTSAASSSSASSSTPTTTSTSSTAQNDAKRIKHSLPYSPVPEGAQREMRDRMLAILFPDYKRPPQRFYESLPGPLPASTTRFSLRLFSRYQYWVCEKSDGQRCCMYVDQSGAYLIDRKFVFLKLNHHLYTQLWGGQGVTILDGELCSSIDASQVSSTQQGTSSLAPYLNPSTSSRPVYMVFDIIALNGDVSVQHLKLGQRLLKIGSGIIGSYRSSIESDPSLSQSVPLVIKAKQFFPAKHVKSKVFDHIRQEGGHSWYVDEKHDVRNQNDGVIFTPDDQNYLHKNNECQPPLLKWKPNHMNTIDFVIKQPFYDKQGKLQLYCGAKVDGSSLCDVMCRVTDITPQQKQELEYALQGRHRAVVECAYEADSGIWSIKHIRPDKLNGNFITVVMSTMETIADNVTQQDLQTACTATLEDTNKTTPGYHSQHKQQPPPKR